jgi:hemoglobin-like flavoprotein
MMRDQIALVQKSFAKLVPIRDAAVRAFYDRLFELDPGLRPLFKSDMPWQRLRLALALSFLVEGLRNREAVVPVLRELGRRHVGYGVRPEHYPIVGEALLWAIEQEVGEGFTPETEAAWRELYRLVSATMIEGGEQLSSRLAA